MYAIRSYYGLAARCGAGVKYPLAGFDLQQPCRQLRRGILHGAAPVGKSGQGLHRCSGMYQTGFRCKGAWRHAEALCSKLAQQSGRIPVMAQAQPERRLPVVGGQDSYNFV